MLFTSTKRLSQFDSDDKSRINILTSNLSECAKTNDLLFNYYWLTTYGQDVVCEDSVLAALHLLNEIRINSITIAGYDSIFGVYGHYDKSLKLTTSEFERELSIKRIVLKNYMEKNITLMTENGTFSLKEVIDKGYKVD